MSEASKPTSKRYATIVADPPWEYDDWPNNPRPDVPRRNSRSKPYPSMSVAEICALPVAALTARDSRLFLWTTNRYLHEAFEVIKAWGFKYVQTLVWHKTGNPSPFGGSVAPIHAEFLLVGRRGKPETVGRLNSSVIAANVKDHSAKPEGFLDHIETVSPGPYLELFARRNRFGWDTWGNEALDHVAIRAAPHELPCSSDCVGIVGGAGCDCTL